MKYTPILVKSVLLPYLSESFLLLSLYIAWNGSSSLRFMLDFVVTWTDISAELLT